jgi:hypothetical protein
MDLRWFVVLNRAGWCLLMSGWRHGAAISFVDVISCVVKECIDERFKGEGIRMHADEVV